MEKGGREGGCGAGGRVSGWVRVGGSVRPVLVVSIRPVSADDRAMVLLLGRVTKHDRTFEGSWTLGH